jgi:hypothetical protein
MHVDERTVLTEQVATRIGIRSSLFQLPQHLACGGVALVGQAPQFVEVALLASKLDELINRIFVTALGTFPKDG